MSTSLDLQENEDEEGDSSCEIELPEHLQKMVDNALAQMSEWIFCNMSIPMKLWMVANLDAKSEVLGSNLIFNN